MLLPVVRGEPDNSFLPPQAYLFSVPQEACRQPPFALLQARTQQHDTLVEDAAKKVLLRIWPEVIRRVLPELEELAAASQRDRAYQSPGHGVHPMADSRVAPARVPAAPANTGSSRQQADVQETMSSPTGLRMPAQEPTEHQHRSQHDPEGSNGGVRRADAGPGHQASALHMALQKLSVPSPPPLDPLSRGNAGSAAAAAGAGEVMLRPHAEEDQIASLCSLPSVPQVAARAAAVAVAAPQQLQARQEGAQSKFRSPGEAIRSKSLTPGRPRWQRWGAIRAALSVADLVCDSDAAAHRMMPLSCDFVLWFPDMMGCGRPLSNGVGSMG